MVPFIVGGVVILLVAALVLFPSFRNGLKVLVGGALGIFVQDLAKTPDGARAVYQQKIDEAQEEYNKVSRVLNRFAGELEGKLRDKARLCKDIQDAERKCEDCIRTGNDRQAAIFSQQRAQLLADLDSVEAYIQQLQPMVAEAKGAHEMYAKKLEQLKVEAKKTVNEMQLNQSMQSLLADLDELRADSATDKLLSAVREGADDLRKETRGGMVVHQNRLSTQVAQAEATAARVQSDAYLESLKAKYRPKQAIPAGTSGTVLDITQTNKTKETERK
ncbi:MAG: hypothetical protein NC548_06510 [Lachnospiraceae bacterium]|nr:hypothetical protein [Lachnospiraceae bacterium]